MEKEFKIKVPDGYEIDKENSTFECIKFKRIKKELPKTWEEYCETHPRRKGEAWYETTYNEIKLIDESSCCINSTRSATGDIDLFPNREYVEAILALCQLIQLRDCYNDGWTPNWSDYTSKYCISLNGNNIEYRVNIHCSRILSFKTRELCNEFLNNFKDLIEIAKPLI